KRRKPSWTYELRLDSKSGLRKTEVLNHGGKTNMLTTYLHALNYDSLRFIGNDGRAYLWVSHLPLDPSKGSRYDILRHALFVANGSHPDPLYGDIVADHTYWDGFINQTKIHQDTICIECQTKPILSLTCLPDKSLYIRSPTVDPALVIASLQVLKDWQKHELRRHKGKDPKNFLINEEKAREHDLGRLSYWR
ncbi:hypothetical protein EJ07DRAFT_63713, partial [Lizonia empirigonia]